MKGIVAKAEIFINADPGVVWQALTDPKMIKEYMFATEVSSQWKVGAPIYWRGEWKGKQYEDKGVILKMEKERLLQYTHFSPLTGKPDLPENYHTIEIELIPEYERTRIVLKQDNNASEQEADHSAQNWKSMLDSLKKLLETGNEF